MSSALLALQSGVTAAAAVELGHCDLAWKPM